MRLRTRSFVRQMNGKASVAKQKKHVYRKEDHLVYRRLRISWLSGRLGLN